MNEASPERGSLGRDLRRLRQSQGMRIAELASLMNRSTGWISQVERDRSHPDFGDLAAFARAFGLPISQLFRHAAQPDGEARDVLRAAQRRSLPSDNTGAIDDMLTPEIDGLHFYHSILLPQSASQNPGRRGLVEQGFVLEGAFEIWIGGRHHSLEVGDSFWSHGEDIRWLNPHDTPCRLIWLLAPLRDDPDA